MADTETATDQAFEDAHPKKKSKLKLKRKDYEHELKRLHIELVKLQEWVRKEGKKICIVFEGRDGAGKGGTIKAITARVSPRVFRVVALPAPTEREKCSASRRPTVSVPPPGAEATMMRTGRVGYVACACAGAAMATIVCKAISHHFA